MKRITWKKHHKWLGIALSLFLLMFCLSGIVLNHRWLVRDVDISRKWLPVRYEYTKWNGGLLRGTLPYTDEDSVRRVLVYGTGGIWRTDTSASAFADFNDGLSDGADYRQIRAVAQTADGSLYALSPFGLYRYGIHTGWQQIPLPTDGDEMLTNMTCKGDTLAVLGRSYLYISMSPHTQFRKIQLQAPSDYDGKVSLFRTVWMLHTGELFGMPGKLVMDAVAVVLVLLSLTGILYWLLPKYMRRRHKQGKSADKAARWTRLSLLWHDKLGRTTLVLTLLIAVTGWCLRPPVLIALALTDTPALPGSTLDSPNPWNDKLRMVRYDTACGDWLLSTSEGFYSLKSFEAIPERLTHTPPVSVMGLNVWQREVQGHWLCGSFSGLFVWNRAQGTATDWFTGKQADDKPGPPFGKKAISGFSADLGKEPFTVEYYNGTNALPQPESLAALPMSLWNFALEVHSGRIYIGIAATYVFVFIAGIAIVWCLWSGWKLQKKNRNKQVHN